MSTLTSPRGLSIPSPSTLILTRQYFADLSRACIDEALSGDVQVNDLPSYVQFHERLICAFLIGDYDDTFTFRQRAHFIQTGECLGLPGDGK